jgi:hypothetical protein
LASLSVTASFPFSLLLHKISGSHHFLHVCMICSFQSSILRRAATRLWYSCWSPFTSLLATFRVHSSQWLHKPLNLPFWIQVLIRVRSFRSV